MEDFFDIWEPLASPHHVPTHPGRYKWLSRGDEMDFVLSHKHRLGGGGYIWFR